ncbi:MAG TPA: acylphosphatase [Steroidobacteraceae bacterium]|nr:acylphosphatase [Steroidobacteraceae bacterium]
MRNILQGKIERGMVSKICWISGRVQGVYYRGTTVLRARELGISGYARNLPDGRVEVLAQGEDAAVAAFIQWLWIGSIASRVTAVEVREASASQLPEGFRSE